MLPVRDGDAGTYDENFTKISRQSMDTCSTIVIPDSPELPGSARTIACFWEYVSSEIAGGGMCG